MGAREKLEADLRELMSENGIQKQQYIYKSVDKLLLLLTGNVIDEWVESEKERGRKAMDDACKDAISSARQTTQNAREMSQKAYNQTIELQKTQLEVLKEIKELRELQASRSKSTRYADAVSLYGELVNEGINRGVTPDIAGTNASYVAWAAIKNEVVAEREQKSIKDELSQTEDADEIERISNLISSLEERLKNVYQTSSGDYGETTFWAQNGVRRNGRR